LILGLAAAPLGVLLWLVLRRRAPARVGDLTLTAVIVLGDDVLIGYAGGHDSWHTKHPGDRGTPHVMEALHGVAGQLLFPDLVRDRDAMMLLQRWRDQGARLTGVVPRDAGVVVLTDRRQRATVVAAFRDWAGSGEFP